MYNLPKKKNKPVVLTGFLKRGRPLDHELPPVLLPILPRSAMLQITLALALALHPGLVRYQAPPEDLDRPTKAKIWKICRESRIRSNPEQRYCEALHHRSCTS